MLHFPRLQLRSRILLIVVVFLVLLWMVLPYDNGLVLILRWHSNTVSSILTAEDRGMFEAPAFPFDENSVGIIVKTGFTTQDRLIALLDGIDDKSNILIVGDYSTAPGVHIIPGRPELPVYNALAWMIQRGYLASRPDSERLQHYLNLASAISNGNSTLAHTIGETHGWELDIMKASRKPFQNST